MSSVTVIGVLGRDPELRFSKAGKAICNFSIAENRGKGEEQVTHWFDVTCFGTLAENVSESLQKGARAIVSGQLEQQHWETQDGDKRSKVAIIAWTIGPSLEFASAVVTKNERSG